MLLYEFPPKLNRAEKQAKALNDLQYHSKIKKNMLKNFVMGAVIIALSFMTKVMLIKAVLIIIGAANIIVGILIYSISAYSYDTKLYSKIFDDRTEHCQRMGYSRNYLHMEIYYDEVERSEQNPQGKLIFYMKNISKSKFWIEGKNGEKKDYQLRDNCITLDFADIKAKLTLVNDLYEKINYPKKNYNKIEDDDDYYSEEDLKWDRLGKHGL